MAEPTRYAFEYPDEAGYPNGRIGALLHEAGLGDPVVIAPEAEEADEGQ